MTEGQPKGITPTEYAFNTLKKVVGVDAFQYYLNGERKPDQPFSLEQKFIAILCCLGQITVPMVTQDILEARSDDSEDIPAKELLRGVRYSLDVTSALLPTFYLIGGSDFATTLIVAKIAAYNTLVAALPETIEVIKQRLSRQK